MPSRDSNALPAMPRHSIGRPRYQPMRAVYETICSCGVALAAATREAADSKVDAHHALNGRK